MNFGSNFNLPSVLQGTGSLELQIGLSLVVLVVAAILVRRVVPWTVHTCIRILQSVLDRFGLGRLLDVLTTEESGWGLGSAIVWLIQLTVVGGLIVLLFGIWGRIDMVYTAMEELAIPISFFAKGIVTILLLVGAYSGMGLLHRMALQVCA